MPETLTTLITDRFDASALALLSADPRLDIRRSLTPFPADDELRDARALIIRSRTLIDRALLERAPRLEVIVTATSGFDHIDLNETKRRTGLTVMHTPDANAASACELTWALVLACSRRLVEAHRAIKAGNWSRDHLLSQQLNGKTYGIVGLGRIGTRVATVAQALGMHTIAFDPYRDDFPPTVTAVGFEELLRLSDFISFHVPATPETRNMLRQTGFEAMQRSTIVVNTSRGSVINERDLIQALVSGKIAACGLDVFEKEPLPRDSALLTLPNAILSPHLGATTGEAFAAASREAAEKIQAYASSGNVSDTLPPNARWFSI